MRCLFISDDYGCGMAKCEDYAIRSMDDKAQLLITLEVPFICEDTGDEIKDFVCRKHDKDKFIIMIPDLILKRLIV